MTTNVLETIDVHVPVRTAYDQWTQFEEFPRFMKDVDEVRQVDEQLHPIDARSKGRNNDAPARAAEDLLERFDDFLDDDTDEE